MKRTIKHTLVLLVFAVFMYGCKDDLELPTAKNSIKPLRENPFSVQAMVNAQRKLEGSAQYAAAGSPKLNPRVTHYYVVFSPSNNQELDMVANSGDIELFEKPLDVSFLGEERAIFEYNLSDLGEDSPGHQFTTVSKDYVFPGVPYEIIAEIYLPFEDPELFGNTQMDTRGSAFPNELPCEQFMLAQEWENQSLEDNGYADFVEVEECGEYVGGGTAGGGNNPYPSNQWGRIQIFDNSPQVGRLIPIEGVRVTTTRFLSWKRSHTNAEGYYKVNSPHHEKKSQYHIKWEDDDFRIIAHSGGQAKLEGPDQVGPWNFNIANNTKAQWYGTAFSAAKQYYDGERYGLAKPDNGNLLRTTIKVRDNGCTSRYMPLADFPLVGAAFFNDIKLCVQNRKDNMSEIYGLAIHELTHSSHIKETSKFNNELIQQLTEGSQGRRVMESWAQGVEWWFTVNKYRALSDNPNWGTYNGFSGTVSNFQQVRTDESRDDDDPTYTSVVIDLIDNFNQRLLRGGDTRYPNDQVVGYTINQVENALYYNGGVALFTNWKHNLLNIYDNPTESSLHLLFASWDN